MEQTVVDTVSAFVSHADCSSLWAAGIRVAVAAVELEFVEAHRQSSLAAVFWHASLDTWRTLGRLQGQTFPPCPAE